MTPKHFQERRGFLGGPALALASGLPTPIAHQSGKRSGGVDDRGRGRLQEPSFVCSFMAGRITPTCLIPYRDSNGTGTTEYDRYRQGRAQRNGSGENQTDNFDW